MKKTKIKPHRKFIRLRYSYAGALVEKFKVDNKKQHKNQKYLENSQFHSPAVAKNTSYRTSYILVYLPFIHNK